MILISLAKLKHILKRKSHRHLRLTGGQLFSTGVLQEADMFAVKIFKNH